MKNCRCERCMKKNHHEEAKKWYPEYEEIGYPNERNYEHEQFEKKNRYEEAKKWYPEYEEKECDYEYEKEYDNEYEKEYDNEYEKEKDKDKDKDDKHCGNYKIKTIYERPVYCVSEEHFHHRVRHIVPIVYKKVENHHTHHEYIIKKQFKKEHKEHEHGKKENKDWCRFGYEKECKEHKGHREYN